MSCEMGVLADSEGRRPLDLARPNLTNSELSKIALSPLYLHDVWCKCER